MAQNPEVVWRAKAYQGQFLDAGDAPYVSTIQGVTSFEQLTSVAGPLNQRCLTIVHNSIDLQMRHRRPVDPEALRKPFMTVSVDRFASSEGIDHIDASQEHIARLDMITVGHFVYGGIWIEAVGEAELDPVQWTEGEDIWEIVVPLLRQVDGLDFGKAQADCAPARSRNTRSER